MNDGRWCGAAWLSDSVIWSPLRARPGYTRRQVFSLVPAAEYERLEWKHERLEPQNKRVDQRKCIHDMKNHATKKPVFSSAMMS